MGETNGDNKKKTAREIIENYNGPKVRIMEVCGTHTHEIFRLGIRKLLPEQVELISGPGCPVCVTPVSFIDEAIYLALEKGVTICTFGDLVRVPGTKMSLAGAREQGGKIHIVYSPADAEKYAKEHPKEQVTFLSVGFETTTPSACLSVKKAREEGLTNYSILTANKTMPQAYEALKGSADIFLYPGHVNAITGTKLCEELVQEGVSGVVAGFTAKELLTALAVALTHFQKGKPFFVNCYPRVVTEEGSKEAQRLVDTLMEKTHLTVNGEDSESYRDQDFVYVMNGGCMMPERNIRFRRWKEGRIRPADAGMYYRENVNHPTVKYLERSVHRSIR